MRWRLIAVVLHTMPVAVLRRFQIEG